ncbi:MAG TPA: chemotaxis protein CheB [Flavisolibacter sp.]|nr:chemotaxis protein CheB [Flavisolibacter sp.]
MKLSDPKYIGGVGTSAAGIRAIEELVLQLAREMDAAFLLFLIYPEKGPMISSSTGWEQLSQMRCRLAIDQDPVRKGTIYLAAPDENILLDKWSSRGAKMQRCN